MTDALPTKKEICEDHGEYQLHCIELFDKKKWIGSCPQCTRWKKNEEDARLRAEDRLQLESTKKCCGISPRMMNKTFNDFKSDPNNAQQVTAKRQFQKLLDAVKARSDTFNIIATGCVGTGKTLLASIIINDLIDNGRRCKMVKAMDMIRNLRETWGVSNPRDRGLKTETEMIEHYSNLDLLIIDEIGTQSGSDNEKQHIFDIIDGRYQNMKPTVLLSNLTLDQVKETVGDRVIDRLREDGGSLVVFDWQSERGAK